MELCPKLRTQPTFPDFFRHGTMTVASVVDRDRRHFMTLSVHLCLQHFDT